MIELIIKNKGSIVVTGNFNSVDEAATWIEEEKKRNEWDRSFTFELAHKATVPSTQAKEDIDAIKLKESLRNQANTDLRSTKPVMTVPELSEAVNKILLILGVK